MKRVIKKSNNKIPLKLWLDYLEDGAEKQADNLSNLSFAFRHIAIMPDSHQGYGMPIGVVLATDGVIVPNAVGVDIGCGMRSVKTNLKSITQEQIKKIFGGTKKYKGGIRSSIPVGMKKHKKKQDVKKIPDIVSIFSGSICDDEFNNALKQLGTLGGGNHFIEIQKGSDGYIWIMVHSGSRHLGHAVATHYNKLAIKLNKKWKVGVPKGWDLAYLPVDSEEGYLYVREMEYAVEYAKKNRELMMDKIMLEFTEVFGYEFKKEEEYDVAHNYARLENHFGKNVWVHRKGATSARTGEIGIIPGSQGSKSYIVEGLGNPESFMSCSHGAGRSMSRSKAREKLSFSEEKKKMKGIIHGIRSKRDLDEAPGSYKNIDEVMENQKDLVKIKVELTPLAVIKG